MSAQTSVKLKQLPATDLWRKALACALPLLYWLASAGGAFLASRAALFGTMYPLGVSIAACANVPYTLCACAGAIVGYALVLPTEQALPYLAALLSVALTRVFSAPKKRYLTTYAPGVVGAMCYFFTAAGMSVLTESGVFPMLVAAAQSMLMAGVAYVLTGAVAKQPQDFFIGNTENTACALVALGVVLCCALPYSVVGVNLGILLGAFVCLYCTLEWGESGAALSGVALCGALVISAPQLLYAGVGVAVASVVTAYFSSNTRAVSAVVFWTAGFVSVPAAPVGMAGLQYMATLALSALVAGILPPLAQSRIRAVHTEGGRASLVALSGRLQTLSTSLESMGKTLSVVCAKMPHKRETYADVCDAVTNVVCKKCAKCSACWTQDATDAFDAFNTLQPILERVGCVTAADLPMPMQSSCLHASRLTVVLSTAYNAYVARRTAYVRGEAMRSAVTEQYNAMATALAGLSAQVYREEIPDKRKARRVEQMFRDIGVEPFEVIVCMDSAARQYVTARLPRVAFTEEEMTLLCKELSALCRCQLMEGTCRQTSASTLLSFAQMVTYAPSVGTYSLPANGKVCADAVKSFHDKTGFFHVLLCDGMGTGKAAALDGTLAATLSQRLLIGGFRASEAARLVNVALSLKGEMDSATTLDVLSINLFTGAAQCYKAGAAASFLVRQGVVTVMEGESLPIGILAKVTGTTESMQLQRGDMLVVVSDGASGEDSDWLCAELTCTELPEPQDLARQLAEKARTRFAKPDDVSVVCVRIDLAPKS